MTMESGYRLESYRSGTPFSIDSLELEVPIILL